MISWHMHCDYRSTCAFSNIFDRNLLPMFSSPNNNHKVINHIKFYRNDKSLIRRLLDKALFFYQVLF